MGKEKIDLLPVREYHYANCICFCGPIKNHMRPALIIADEYTADYCSTLAELRVASDYTDAAPGVWAVCPVCIPRLGELRRKWHKAFIPAHLPEALRNSLAIYLRKVNGGSV